MHSNRKTVMPIIENDHQGILAKRFYYSEAISGFLKRSDEEVVGALTVASRHDINAKSEGAWLDELRVMRKTLSDYSDRGSVFFEYNIPRLGRRADVITLIDNVVFVIEFKTEDTDEFTREAFLQVWDYAIDLKNFQLGSRERIIIPILVAPKAPTQKCTFILHHYEDNVYLPMSSNAELLGSYIAQTLKKLNIKPDFDYDRDMRWAKSGYEPTPTIVEAAIALFNHQNVEDITKHEANLDKASQTIDRIIDYSSKNHRKSICFVTGVPGAGKTLIGLQTAIRHFDSNKDEGAVYLSGNYPLVQVLQEALARDYVRQDKLKKKDKKEKVVTKKEAQSKVKAFIQMIHHYRDTYLEGIQIDGDHLSPIPGYFTSHQDKAYVPTEHVAIFDEAQRAWTKDELARFLADKTKGRANVLNEFPYSEPEFLISTIDRHQDWGVIICLIGGGQEINKGESGIAEWVAAINRRYQDWDVYISDRLTDEEYAKGRPFDLINQKHLHIESGLHLAISMRSFRAENVAKFVHELLALEPEKAAETLKQLDKYPIILTRSLDKAKQWLKEHQRGTERMGILASSKADRLKAISINVRYQPDFVQWFLADDDDIRSSNRLEDTLTEFKVQGLEIDWACVAWDADLRLNKEHTAWEHWELRSGTKWQKINKPIRQQYQLNAYRVLLTRARQGMIIVVPEGDRSIPPDDTRKPEWYDGIYSYLKNLGLKEI